MGRTTISKTRTYRIWNTMLTRCTNPNHNTFRSYGARGIKVCDRWSKFKLFLFDMGEAPKGRQLDRIDNSKGYNPSNCRWATPKENCRNKTNNLLLTFNGVTLTSIEWAEKLGLHRSAVGRRIRKGWSLEKAVTFPKNFKKVSKRYLTKEFLSY